MTRMERAAPSISTERRATMGAEDEVGQHRDRGDHPPQLGQREDQHLPDSATRAVT